MEKVTKETYREYLCNRLKDLTEALEGLPPSRETLKLNLEIRRDIDWLMQQLYLLDNKQEEE